jgi:hypothetical protein
VSAPAAAGAKPAPSITLLLAPLTRGLSEPERPAFLARLERLAAERYRSWAQQAPAHAALLLACAAREEEIAARADRLFPMSAAQEAKLGELLPRARQIYSSLFVGLPLREQLAFQASAERQGGAVWRALGASAQLSDEARAELAACAALEDESAAQLDALIQRWGE